MQRGPGLTISALYSLSNHIILNNLQSAQNNSDVLPFASSSIQVNKFPSLISKKIIMQLTIIADDLTYFGRLPVHVSVCIIHIMLETLGNSPPPPPVV